jgi:hypothetical protein
LTQRPQVFNAWRRTQCLFLPRMGLFKRLFKKRSKPTGTPSAKRLRQLEKLAPQSTPMSSDRYWKIIARSLRKTRTMEEQRQKLVVVLSKLKCADIVAFHLRTNQLLGESYHEDLLCALYLVEGRFDMKSFDYFRCWIISRGRRVFENALRNPDTLLVVFESELEDHLFETFYYVAEEAFENETGSALQNYIAAGHNEIQHPEIELSWSATDPDSMHSICPALFRKYGRH